MSRAILRMALVLAITCSTALAACGGGDDACFPDSKGVNCTSHCKPAKVDFLGFDDRNPFPCGDVTCKAGEFCCACK